jgi:hypothetical protein
VHRLYIQRFGGSATTWKQRLMLVVTGALALVITIGLLITGFFIAMAVLGVGLLVAAVLWVRNRLFGGRRAAAVATGRTPVIIEGDYVVLSRGAEGARRTRR